MRSSRCTAASSGSEIVTDYIRNLPVKIVTVEVMKKTHGRYKSPVGWKVYINGAKYPPKPMEYYMLTEEGAILIATDDYKRKHGV